MNKQVEDLIEQELDHHTTSDMKLTCGTDYLSEHITEKLASILKADCQRQIAGAVKAEKEISFKQGVIETYERFKEEGFILDYEPHIVTDELWNKWQSLKEGENNDTKG